MGIAKSGIVDTIPAPRDGGVLWEEGMRLETRYAKSDGVSIAYQVVEPPGEVAELDLVFVMGWVSHLDYFWEEPHFARFLRRLASFSRLILFDKRGTGLSDRVAIGALPTLEQRMDDVRAVMDAAGSRRAALMGVSEGAAMCALFAATYPQRTAALVMVGGYARRLWAPDYPWGDARDEQRRFQADIERSWPIDGALEERAPSVAQDPHFRAWWATYLRMSASPGAAVALSRMNAEVDIRHVLPSIRVPALILHRTGDRSLPVEGSRYVAQHIPGARCVELPGDDHLPFVGDQDAILNEIEVFLTGAAPAPAPDRALLTVLALEVVHATETAARLGAEKWQMALEAHGALAREDLARFRGRQIRTSGVGLLATFDGPARAIRCAIAIAEAARSHDLAVSAGVHTGECDVVAGEVSGPPIQVACAILAQARPGDVLVSSTVKDLVAGAGLAFEDQGTHLLDGVADAWRVFRVQEGPPGSAPPPGPPLGGARDAPSASLPARLTEREREVAALLARGLSNRQIAAALVITTATAERHVTNVLTKLGFHSRTQIAAWAAKQALHRARFA